MTPSKHTPIQTRAILVPTVEDITKKLRAQLSLESWRETGQERKRKTGVLGCRRNARNGTEMEVCGVRSGSSEQRLHFQDMETGAWNPLIKEGRMPSRSCSDIMQKGYEDPWKLFNQKGSMEAVL